MEVFITERNVLMEGLDHFTLILCSFQDTIPSEHIYGSVVFYIPQDVNSFILRLRKLDINDKHTLLCYDNSSYQEASIVYWGLQSAGLKSQILARKSSVYNSLVVISGPPQEMLFHQDILRNINSDFIKIRENEMQLNQEIPLLNINSLPYSIVDFSGKVLDKDGMKYAMHAAGILIEEEELMVMGEKATLAAACFSYIGKSKVMVVIDDLHKNEEIEDKMEMDIFANNGKICENSFYNPSLNIYKSRDEVKRMSGFRNSACCSCGIF